MGKLLGWVAVFAVGLGVGYVVFKNSPIFGGTSIVQSWYAETTTSTVGTSVTNVLAQTGNPGNRYVVNNSSSSIWCYYDGVTTAANSALVTTLGREIGASSTALLAPGTNVLNASGYVGNVNCISPEVAPIAIIK